MTKDVLAIIGLVLILIGIYFIYWPMCLVISGLVLTGYCLWITYIEARDNIDADS